MAYNSNFRSSEITGANPVTITNEAQVVVDLGYKSAGSRGVLLSEAPLKESPSTIVMVVGGTTFTEVDISAFTGAANTFAVEYASNSGVILLPPGTALGTATTTTYKGLGSVATIESKRYNPDGLVTAPSVSFEDDPDTGLYRIGANNMGFAAGGVQTSQLNSLGLLNGTLGTEYRNILQIVNNNSPGQNTGNNKLINNTAQSYDGLGNYVVVLQGTITPKSSSSVILVNGTVQFQIGNASTGLGYAYLGVNTISYGAIQSASATFPGLQAYYGSLNSLTGSFQMAGNQGISHVLTGLAAGTTYHIAVTCRYVTGSPIIINLNGTTSSMYFMEVL